MICKDCGGKGFITTKVYTNISNSEFSRVCPSCRGTGFVSEETGKWIDIYLEESSTIIGCFCSNCMKRPPADIKTPFCPYCGKRKEMQNE